jgi:hypothetical protein
MLLSPECVGALPFFALTLEIFLFVVSGPHLAQLSCRRALQDKTLLMGGSSQMIPRLSLLLSIPSLVAR